MKTQDFSRTVQALVFLFCVQGENRLAPHTGGGGGNRTHCCSLPLTEQRGERTREREGEKERIKRKSQREGGRDIKRETKRKEKKERKRKG